MKSRDDPSTQKRVLIIEDDGTIAELERDYLEAAGFVVCIESDGKAGLSRALAGLESSADDFVERRDFDLFIVDIMLPNADGFTICRELRAKAEKPVIVVSARDADIDKVRALGLGVDDYLTKPFSPAELVARARAHLERYERLTAGGRLGQTGTINHGDLSIETINKAVFVAGKLAPLTLTEYTILLLLAKNPGRVFSREEIFEKIRGEGAFGDVTTITVHIRRLREKIEADPSAPVHLETVWGIGYRFGL